MPIAPITGMLKKHMLTHIAIGGVGGIASGYLYWYTMHVPKIVQRDAYYLAAEKAKVEA